MKIAHQYKELKSTLHTSGSEVFLMHKLYNGLILLLISHSGFVQIELKFNRFGLDLLPLTLPISVLIPWMFTELSC
jgi:hypothetical protein